MITNFIQENFLYLHPGYTILNTIVFGIILGISIILIIKMFKFIKKDPIELTIPLIPFIFFGSSTRALVDNGVYPLTLLLVTPGIYVLTGLITIITLLIAVFIERKFNIDYRKILMFAGILLCLPNIYLIPNFNLTAALAIIGAWALIFLPFIIIMNMWDVLRNKYNLTVLSAHLFDASSTFIAVDYYGYGEQHVLPNALTTLTGTAFIMFPLKIGIILLALHVIDQHIEDETIKNMLKLAIFILGLAPGLRNFLSLAIGTY